MLLEPEPLCVTKSLWMPRKVRCNSCHIFCCIRPHSPCISMWSVSAVLSVAVRSRWSFLGSYLDCLSWCHSVGYSVRPVVIFNLVRDPFGSHITVVRYLIRNCSNSHIAVIRNLVRNCFGIRICTRSAWNRLVWLIIFSPAYLQVYWTFVVYEVSLSSQIAGCARWLSSGCAGWFICGCACHHLMRCT